MMVLNWRKNIDNLVEYQIIIFCKNEKQIDFQIKTIHKTVINLLYWKFESETKKISKFYEEKKCKPINYAQMKISLLSVSFCWTRKYLH